MMPHHPPSAPSVKGVWPCRIYPGDLSHTSRVRAEIRADLAALPHLPAGLVDAVELCASEAFANAVEHTRSGQEGGRVVRSLTRPAHNRLRLAVVDDGTTDTTPASPASAPRPNGSKPKPDAASSSSRPSLRGIPAPEISEQASNLAERLHRKRDNDGGHQRLVGCLWSANRAPEEQCPPSHQNPREKPTPRNQHPSQVATSG